MTEDKFDTDRPTGPTYSDLAYQAEWDADRLPPDVAAEYRRLAPFLTCVYWEEGDAWDRSVYYGVSPRAFAAAVGPRPSPAHVVGRRDRGRGLAPDNLCWVRSAPPVPPKYLNIDQAAAYTGLAASTLYKDSKRIDRAPNTRKFLATAEALDAYMTARRRNRPVHPARRPAK